MNTNRKLEDEINFKKAFTNPLRLFGWVFLLFIFLILILGIYFISQLDNVSINSQPVGVKVDSTYFKTEIEMKKGGISPAVDLTLVKNPSQEYVNKGKEMFKANCSSCHGENGMGDGSASAALNPKPRNFHSLTGWTNGRTIDMMYKTLQEGIIKNGMAAYEYLAPADRFAIISYIRTFVEFPPIKDEELNTLDTQYQISKGMVVPTQIPVMVAEEKILEEKKIESEKIDTALKLLTASKENKGAVILKKTSLDYKKVFTSFLNLPSNRSFETFISSVIANPINCGFKPSITEYSKEEFKLVYDYLQTVLM